MPAYDLGRVFNFRRWPPDEFDRLAIRMTFKTPANDDAPVGRKGRTIRTELTTRIDRVDATVKGLAKQPSR